ncbi:MAG TPA: hypothetical protein VII19_03145 [Acidimicrobiales bacterium]
MIIAGLLVRPSPVLVNGAKVLIPLGFPLVAVALVALALWLRRRHSMRWAGVVARVLAALLDGLAVLGVLTIGIFVFPVAVAVTMACASG